jgi:serine/threonine protein kinase
VGLFGFPPDEPGLHFALFGEPPGSIAVAADLPRARELFLHSVGKVPPERWAGYVAEACGDDGELERQVGHLLRVHLEAGSFLDEPAALPAGTGDYVPAGGAEERYAGPPEQPGTTIGRYRLIEPIGEGGMGEVWMAEQSEPVRRTVALKLIKTGMGSGQVLVRLEAERQALALMDHPNIAKVLDAGTTPDGRPFFVMDLVRGVPITRYCDENRLTPRQRLELFVPVCQAIQHAHQKGIIHRDVKPSNVLVALYDDKPVPKVIDFGVAKAVGQVLTEKSLHTGFGAVVGTVEYMSPEQASFNQLDVDTRSDVYSLGVVLYELLAGSPPFARKEMEAAGLLEVLRVIREEEPPRPSARLAAAGALPELAANRGTEPRRLATLVRGEPDWIAMKALEKDRNRRYESPGSLAADVQRYLADEPVLAGPPSAWYRFGKFARRHRQLLAGALAFVVLLLAALGAIATAFVALRHQQGETQKALEAEGKRRRDYREALDRQTSFVLEDLLGRQSVLTEEHKAFLRQTLRAYEEFAADVGEEREVRAAVANAYLRVGEIRTRLGEARDAQAALRRSCELYAELAADGSPEFRERLAHTYVNLGGSLQVSGDFDPAGEAYTQALIIRRRLAEEFPTRPEHRRNVAICHRNLTSLYRVSGRAAAAEEEAGKAIAILEGLVAGYPGNLDYRTGLADAFNNLGVVFKTSVRSAEAEKPYVTALTIRRQLVAELPADLDQRREMGTGCNNLGSLYKDLKRYEESEKLLREAMVIRRQLAADFPNRPEYRQDLAVTCNNLGVVLRTTNRRDEAVEPLRQGLALHRQLAADFPNRPDHQNDAAGAMVNLARLLYDLKDYPAARRLLDEAVPFHQAALKANPRHPTYRFFFRNNRQRLAETLLALKDHAAAADAADQFLKAATDPPRDAYRSACFLAGCARLAEADRPELARGYADRAVAALRQAVANGYKDVGELKKDRDLDPLRTRDDFRTLLGELESRKK